MVFLVVSGHASTDSDSEYGFGYFMIGYVSSPSVSIGLQLLLCVRYTLFHTFIYYYCTLSIILISLYNTALKYIYHEQNVNLLSSKLIYVYPYPCMLLLHMIFPDHSLFTYENMEICVYLILLCEILNPYFENIIMNVFDYPLLYLFLLYLLNVYYNYLSVWLTQPTLHVRMPFHLKLAIDIHVFPLYIINNWHTTSLIYVEYTYTCIPYKGVFICMYRIVHSSTRIQNICRPTSKGVSTIEIVIEKMYILIRDCINTLYLLLFLSVNNISSRPSKYIISDCTCIIMLHVSMLYHFPLHSFRNTTVFHNEPIEFNIIFMAKLCVKHVYDYG